ncbi:MAG: ABC transporter permease [Vicinamibacterales bacterium]
MQVWQDFRFAVRLLLKGRWFTLAAVLALALGIAANSTVFTIVNALLIRGLPFDHPEQIVSLTIRDNRGRSLGMSFQDYEDYRASARTFASLTYLVPTAMNISEEGRAPEQFQGAYASANIFDMLGEHPILGRGLTADDDRVEATPVLVLGSSAWKGRYGSDPAVIGRVVRVNNRVSTIVGVMRDGMRFPFNADVWIPTAQRPPVLFNQTRGQRGWFTVGRLKDGVTMVQGEAELATIAARLAQEYPTTNRDIKPVLMTFNQQLMGGGPLEQILLVLMGAVGFVLLIACANVANLQLVRSASRAREMSVRLALGATRGRIVRQLLVESILLAAVSGVVGLALSAAGAKLADWAMADVNRPYWMTFTLDGTVLGFVAAVSLGTAIVFGLAPALHVSRTNVNDVLKDGGRSGTSGRGVRRWMGGLVVAELALTLVLLAGAGFMVRSFLALYRQDMGFNPTGLMTMVVSITDLKYPTPQKRAAFLQQVEERLAAVPGIESSGLTSFLPIGFAPAMHLSVEGRAEPPVDQRPLVTTLQVSPRYFETLGVGVRQGRGFTARDGLDNVVVNERFVAMHFPGESPIGRRIGLTFQGAVPPNWSTIVGVVPTMRQRDFQTADPDPVVYQSLWAGAVYSTPLVIRSRLSAGALTPLLREELRLLDPDAPLLRIQTMEAALATSRWTSRVFGSMFVVFAVIALVLSSMGIYAVTAYIVTQRTPEIGIRMALGAEPKHVGWLILKGALVRLTIGLAIGMAGALAVGRALRSILAQTSPTDPLTLISIAALFCVISLVASLWPARRATRLDPLVALRQE